MSPKVGLFDYGSGNLHSAARAFENAGADLVVTGDIDELRRQDALVVPGVGAFAACMTALPSSRISSFSTPMAVAPASMATV